MVIWVVHVVATIRIVLEVESEGTTIIVTEVHAIAAAASGSHVPVQILQVDV